MVPIQNIDDYVSQITGAEIAVDNTYDFEALRGGQEGTAEVQT